jgi:DNA-directed RNA polymerase specialized sigma24 family protein
MSLTCCKPARHSLYEDLRPLLSVYYSGGDYTPFYTEALPLLTRRGARRVSCLPDRYAAAAEAAHDTLAKVAATKGRPTQYRPEKGPLTAWLLPIHNNAATDLLRQRKASRFVHFSEQEQSESLFIDHRPGISSELEADELVGAVAGQTGGEGLRQVLLLLADGHNQTAVGQALSLSHATVSRRREQLRQFARRMQRVE